MLKVVFKCKTLTPMFCYGADQKTPELRAPSFKGALRFWWRAANFHLSIEELRKKEAEIFGDSGEQGKSKVFVKVLDKDKKKLTSVWREIPYNEKTSKKGKRYKVSLRHKGLTYLFYSMMMQNEKQSISPGNKFNFVLSGYNETALIHAIAAFWILSFFGGIGGRSRRGGGNFRVIDMEDKAGIVQKTRLEFVLKGGDNESIAEQILKNFKIAKEIINEGNKTRFVSEYSNLSISRFILSNTSFDSWTDALNDIGEKFAYFRAIHRSEIFNVASFGFPILHRNRKTNIIAGKGVKQDGKVIDKIERRSSPLIFKILEIDNKFYWLLVRLSGEFLPENRVLVSKNEQETQKPDFALFDDFWSEAMDIGSEYVLSIPDELEDLKQKIIEELSPEKIILFGSRARGDFHKNSDIDIVVKTDKSVELSNINGNIDLLKLDSVDKTLHDKILKEGFEI